MLQKLLSIFVLLFFSTVATSSMVNASTAIASKDNHYRVHLDIPAFDTSNYEKPYTSVWIANTKNQPLRVLQLWYEDDRWLKDLKYFWRRVLRINLQAADGVTGATRGPGQYTLDWDGLDRQGDSLSPGQYKLCAEVAREHGGRTAKCLQFEYPLAEAIELRLEGEFTRLAIEGQPQ